MVTICYNRAMKEQASTNIAQIEDIRVRLLQGKISYDQAKAEAAPVIERINEKAKEIAKKHGKRPGLVSFAALMR